MATIEVPRYEISPVNSVLQQRERVIHDNTSAYVVRRYTDEIAVVHFHAELSVPGRFTGHEVDVEVSVTDIYNVEEGDVIRFTAQRGSNILYEYSGDIGLGSQTNQTIENTLSHVIPASVFSGEEVGEIKIAVSILRDDGNGNNEVQHSVELIYQVAPIPTFDMVSVTPNVVQLPLFVPINIIADFQLSGSGYTRIVSRLVFNNRPFNNISVDPHGAFSIAITNVRDLEPPPVIHTITVEVNAQSVFGQVTLSRTFADIITVIPNIMTWGVDTKYEYELILCHPNKKQLAHIEYYDVSWNPVFLEYNELNFSVYREIVTEDGDKYINPIWGKIFSDGVILLNIRIGNAIVYSEYFVIENPEHSTISYSGLDELKFKASSYEKIFLNDRDLSGFIDTPKRLWFNCPAGCHNPQLNLSLRGQCPSCVDPNDGLPRGIMNYILRMKWNNVWTLRYIDGRVLIDELTGLPLERVLSFTGNNLRYVIDTLEESYNCVFVFDSVNMAIDIHARRLRPDGMLEDSFGNNRGLVIADDTHSLSISYNEDTANIRTRVFVFGKNNATIARYNPTGQLYVDDFSYFMNLRFMTQDLIDALAAYNEKIQRYQDGRLLTDGETWQQLVNAIDAWTASNPTSPIPSHLVERIGRIIQDLAWETNFTREQIVHLTSFIKEETININTISNGRELYRFALRHLETSAFAPIAISIDVIDVFALEEHQKDWLKFRVGDFVNIYREELDLVYKEMRLISYEHNHINNTLRLEFSNRDKLITMQWLNNRFMFLLENILINNDSLEPVVNNFINNFVTGQQWDFDIDFDFDEIWNRTKEWLGAHALPNLIVREYPLDPQEIAPFIAQDTVIVEYTRDPNAPRYGEGFTDTFRRRFPEKSHWTDEQIQDSFQGKSAFDAARERGFAGTEDDFDEMQYIAISQFPQILDALLRDGGGA